MNVGRINNVYRGLTAQERAALVYLAIADDRVIEPGILRTMPIEQQREFSRLMMVGQVLQNYMGHIARDLARRTQACSLRYLLGYEQITNSAISMMVICQTNVQDLTPTGADSRNKVNYRSMLKVFETPNDLIRIAAEELPTIHDEVMAFESELHHRLAELGVPDHLDQFITEQIAYCQENGELVRCAINGAFDLQISFSDAPSEEAIESLRTRLDGR